MAVKTKMPTISRIDQSVRDTDFIPFTELKAFNEKLDVIIRKFNSMNTTNITDINSVGQKIKDITYNMADALVFDSEGNITGYNSQFDNKGNEIPIEGENSINKILTKLQNYYNEFIKLMGNDPAVDNWKIELDSYFNIALTAFRNKINSIFTNSANSAALEAKYNDKNNYIANDSVKMEKDVIMRLNPDLMSYIRSINVIGQSEDKNIIAFEVQEAEANTLVFNLKVQNGFMHFDFDVILDNDVWYISNKTKLIEKEINSLLIKVYRYKYSETKNAYVFCLNTNNPEDNLAYNFEIQGVLVQAYNFNNTNLDIQKHAKYWKYAKVEGLDKPIFNETYYVKSEDSYVSDDPENSTESREIWVPYTNLTSFEENVEYYIRTTDFELVKVIDLLNDKSIGNIDNNIIKPGHSKLVAENLVYDGRLKEVNIDYELEEQPEKIEIDNSIQMYKSFETHEIGFDDASSFSDRFSDNASKTFIAATKKIKKFNNSIAGAIGNVLFDIKCLKPGEMVNTNLFYSHITYDQIDKTHITPYYKTTYWDENDIQTGEMNSDQKIKNFNECARYTVDYLDSANPNREDLFFDYYNNSSYLNMYISEKELVKINKFILENINCINNVTIWITRASHYYYEPSLMEVYIFPDCNTDYDIYENGEIVGIDLERYINSGLYYTRLVINLSDHDSKDVLVYRQLAVDEETILKHYSDSPSIKDIVATKKFCLANDGSGNIMYSEHGDLWQKVKDYPSISDELKLVACRNGMVIKYYPGTENGIQYTIDGKNFYNTSLSFFNDSIVKYVKIIDVDDNRLFVVVKKFNEDKLYGIFLTYDAILNPNNEEYVHIEFSSSIENCRLFNAACDKINEASIEAVYNGYYYIVVATPIEGRLDSGDMLISLISEGNVNDYQVLSYEKNISFKYEDFSYENLQNTSLNPKCHIVPVKGTQFIAYISLNPNDINDLKDFREDIINTNIHKVMMYDIIGLINFSENNSSDDQGLHNITNDASETVAWISLDVQTTATNKNCLIYANRVEKGDNYDNNYEVVIDHYGNIHYYNEQNGRVMTRSSDIEKIIKIDSYDKNANYIVAFMNNKLFINTEERFLKACISGTFSGSITITAEAYNRYLTSCNRIVLLNDLPSVSLVTAGALSLFIEQKDNAVEDSLFFTGILYDHLGMPFGENIKRSQTPILIPTIDQASVQKLYDCDGTIIGETNSFPIRLNKGYEENYVPYTREIRFEPNKLEKSNVKIDINLIKTINEHLCTFTYNNFGGMGDIVENIIDFYIDSHKCTITFDNDFIPTNYFIVHDCYSYVYVVFVSEISLNVKFVKFDVLKTNSSVSILSTSLSADYASIELPVYCERIVENSEAIFAYGYDGDYEKESLYIWDKGIFSQPTNLISNYNLALTVDAIDYFKIHNNVPIISTYNSEDPDEYYVYDTSSENLRFIQQHVVSTHDRFSFNETIEIDGELYFINGSGSNSDVDYEFRKYSRSVVNSSIGVKTERVISDQDNIFSNTIENFVVNKNFDYVDPEMIRLSDIYEENGRLLISFHNNNINRLMYLCFEKDLVKIIETNENAINLFFDELQFIYENYQNGHFVFQSTTYDVSKVVNNSTSNPFIKTLTDEMYTKYPIKVDHESSDFINNLYKYNLKYYIKNGSTVPHFRTFDVASTLKTNKSAFVSYTADNQILVCTKGMKYLKQITPVIRDSVVDYSTRFDEKYNFIQQVFFGITDATLEIFIIVSGFIPIIENNTNTGTVSTKYPTTAETKLYKISLSDIESADNGSEIPVTLEKTIIVSGESTKGYLQSSYEISKSHLRSKYNMIFNTKLYTSTSDSYGNIITKPVSKAVLNNIVYDNADSIVEFNRDHITIKTKIISEDTYDKTNVNFFGSKFDLRNKYDFPDLVDDWFEKDINGGKSYTSPFVNGNEYVVTFSIDSINSSFYSCVLDNKTKHFISKSDKNFNKNEFGKQICITNRRIVSGLTNSYMAGKNIFNHDLSQKPYNIYKYSNYIQTKFGIFKTLSSRDIIRDDNHYYINGNINGEVNIINSFNNESYIYFTPNVSNGYSVIRTGKNSRVDSIYETSIGVFICVKTIEPHNDISRQRLFKTYYVKRIPSALNNNESHYIYDNIIDIDDSRYFRELDTNYCKIIELKETSHGIFAIGIQPEGIIDLKMPDISIKTYGFGCTYIMYFNGYDFVPVFESNPNDMYANSYSNSKNPFIPVKILEVKNPDTNSTDIETNIYIIGGDTKRKIINMLKIIEDGSDLGIRVADCYNPSIDGITDYSDLLYTLNSQYISTDEIGFPSTIDSLDGISTADFTRSCFMSDTAKTVIYPRIEDDVILNDNIVLLKRSRTDRASVLALNLDKKMIETINVTNNGSDLNYDPYHYFKVKYPLFNNEPKHMKYIKELFESDVLKYAKSSCCVNRNLSAHGYIIYRGYKVLINGIRIIVSNNSPKNKYSLQAVWFNIDPDYRIPDNASEEFKTAIEEGVIKDINDETMIKANFSFLYSCED